VESFTTWSHYALCYCTQSVVAERRAFKLAEWIARMHLGGKHFFVQGSTLACLVSRWLPGIINPPALRERVLIGSIELVRKLMPTAQADIQRKWTKRDARPAYVKRFLRSSEASSTPAT